MVSTQAGNGTPPPEACQATTIQRVASLPPGSWLVEYTDKNSRGFCGDNVDIFDHGLVEGCWDDDFKKYNFDTAASFFGTGVKFLGSEVLFAGPTHTFECLFVLEKDDGYLVSNSLAFIIEHDRVELPLDVPYGKRFATMTKGFGGFERIIVDNNRYRISRSAYENILIKDNALHFVQKEFTENFYSFRDYRDYLTAAMRACLENASSVDRRTRFSPIAMCSSGYDSVASMAIAASLGCHSVLTLRTARGGGEDSGKAAAQAIGLEVHEVERQEASETSEFPEAEFIATGAGGEEYVFQVFEPNLRNRALVSGFYGGSIWDINFTPPLPFAVVDNSGMSLAEFRFRVGFINIPMAVIGATQYQQILDIAKSADMKDFSVGGGYDRPIPRRIAEEAGVPRECFGQRKRAASVLLFRSDSFLTPTSRADLRNFVKKHANLSRYLGQTIWSVRFLLTRKITKILRIFGLKKYRKFHESILVGDLPIFGHSSPIYSDLMFLWSLEKVRMRYRLGAKGKSSRE